MTKEQRPQAEVTKVNALSMQVCVPKKWNNKGIEQFANAEILCGTANGWKIRKGSLNGDPCRNPCDARKDFVHVTLDA